MFNFTIAWLVAALTLDAINFTGPVLIEKCGCIFKSKSTADCSNRENIDFKCLSESKPEELLLKQNNYTKMPSEMFDHEFNEILHIDISENSIEHLPEDFSAHFVGCKSANFSCNNLTDLTEVQRIDSKVKLSVLGNHFQCDCDDPNNIPANNHAKKQGASLTCYSAVYKRDIPLTAKCHAQFNSDQPKEGTLLNILAYGAAFAIIVVLAFVCCQRRNGANLYSQSNERLNQLIE